DVPDYSAATISGHPEFGDNNTSLGPWVWGVGGLILGAIVVGIVMFARSKKAGSDSSTNYPRVFLTFRILTYRNLTLRQSELQRAALAECSYVMGSRVAMKS